MKKPIAILIALGVLLTTAMPVFGHGVVVEHTSDPTTGDITVTAAYDTGELLDDAQVAIFAPDAPAEPWQTGATDTDGEYTFTPDYDNEGFWAVQVRKAGHGGLVNIELDSSMAPADDAADDDSTTGAASIPSVILVDGDGAEMVITGGARIHVTGDISVQSSDAGTSIVTDNTMTTTNDEPRTLSGSTGGFTVTQILLMSASITWGCIGTALYFMQRNKRRKSPTP